MSRVRTREDGISHWRTNTVDVLRPLSSLRRCFVSFQRVLGDTQQKEPRSSQCSALGSWNVNCARGESEGAVLITITCKLRD